MTTLTVTMATSYRKELLFYLLMTLTLRRGPFGSGEVVVRSGETFELCDAEEFEAVCRADEVVYMKNARYGRMRTGRCVSTNYGYVGCGGDVLHLADWMCSGRPQCRIPVPNSAFKRATDCPNDLKPYFEAGYECLPVQTAATQTCQSFILPSTESGFLSNHITMNTHKGSADCPWMIQGRAGQRVNFTVYDFARHDLRSLAQNNGAEKTCRVYAVVRERGKRQGSTVCSGNGRTAHAYLSTSNAVEVRIMGKKSKHNQEYFLLKYDIIGCANPELPEHAWIERDGDAAVIGCPATNKKWRLVCTGTTWSGTYGNCTGGSGKATLGEIVWGNLFMSFEVSLTIVVGIAIGIGIIILACGVVCIRSACRPRKKPKNPRQTNTKPRPVNTVPPQRSHHKRPMDTLKKPLPPSPRSPGVAITHETHGPLPPPPSFLMDKDAHYITENEYAYISELPPPPPSPPPLLSPHNAAGDVPDVVLANPMTYQTAKEIVDSDPDYTSPPTPYTSPRHTKYDIDSLRSSEDNIDTDSSIGGYFYKNKYSAFDPRNDSNFAMKIYSGAPPGDPPSYYEAEAEVPYNESRDSQTPSPFNCGSLQSRYWRNKTSGIFNALDPDQSSLSSKSGNLPRDKI